MKNPLFLLVALVALVSFLPSNAYAQTPEEEFEAKLEEIDITDADQLFEVAQWAMGNKKSSKVRKEGRKLLKEVIELDEDHEQARAALGYVYYKDKWLKKKDYEKARRKEMEAEMKAKGYQFYKGGWIKKADRRKWNNKWEKNDDGVWMSYEEVMRAKGFTFYDGAWLKLSEDDRKRMEHHRKMTGEDILVVTTPHFVLHIDRSAKWAEKYQEAIERTYEWYMDEFKIDQPLRDNLFRGRAHIWTFKNAQQFQDWITTYSEQYQFTDEDKETFRKRPGGYLLSGKRIICTVRKKAEDLENPMLHHIGTLMLNWQTHFRAPSWMTEAIGHLSEECNTTQKYGHTNCTTNTRYGGDGGIAGKEFNTKDGKPRAKSIVKAGDERALLELSMLGLNSLNGDDLAQGFSIFDYLYKKRRDDMGEWFKAFPKVKIPKSIEGAAEKRDAKCVKDATEATLADSVNSFEEEWRAYVKKYYR